MLNIVLLLAPMVTADIIHDEKDFAGAVTVSERATDGDYAWVTLDIPFRDMRNTVRLGQARVYYSKNLDASGLVPVLGHVHYEVPLEIAKPYCDRGYIVVTPHAGKYPLELIIGDSVNMNIAMIQWVRRLPIVDRSRLQMTGGSAGGCMTLAMGAEFFPISALVPQLPAVNWVHGVHYLQANLEVTGYTLPMAQRPLPVLSLIAPGVRLATDLYGPDLNAPSYYTVSAISYLDRIAAPTLIVAATGDMLCRFEQFTAKKFFEQDHSLFPSEYQSDFDILASTQRASRRFDECVPEERLAVFPIRPIRGMREYTIEDVLDPENLSNPLRLTRPTPNLALPWSKDKQWSLVILDEGAPLPHLGHTRYIWDIDPIEFLLYHRDRDPAVDQLRAANLLRLMERYDRKLTAVETMADGAKANRLSFEALDRLEVLTGLLDYADVSPAHLKHLDELYATCPVRPFGDKLQLRDLRGLRDKLRP